MFGASLMNMTIEEKKYSVSSRGNIVARAYFLCPRFAGTEKITAFYETLAENLRSFFEETAEKYRAEYEGMDRAARRAFEPICVRLFSSVEYADEALVSVTQEYVVSAGKTVMFYRKFCQVWQRESEILLPAKRLFPRCAVRKAERNEFYFDGERAVIVENLFPETSGETGRRARLCNYVRETAYEVKKV